MAAMSHEQLLWLQPYHCGMVRACGQDIKLEDLERGGLFEVSHLLEHSEYGHQPHIQGRSAPPLRVLMARLLCFAEGETALMARPCSRSRCLQTSSATQIFRSA